MGLLLLTTSLTTMAADNLVIVSIDGLRWQEVFLGIDKPLLENENYTNRTDFLKTTFCTAENCQQSQIKLLPFMHNTIAREGVLFGNRQQQQCMKVTNPWYFSYPGYNELLTGTADPSIDSNQKINNPNVTLLEALNNKSVYSNKVVAFGSWDVFPYIINQQRSQIPVNAGFSGAAANKKTLSRKEALLDQLLKDIPSPWENVRLDAFTQHYALETIRQQKPRVIYIAYGETDDFAHDGDYDQYITSAHRTDRFIHELWDTLQEDPFYRGKTHLFITTDHGRGHEPQEAWQHHASKRSIAGYMQGLKQYPEGIIGSDDIWFAAIGPSIQPDKALTRLRQEHHCYGLNQIAATALQTLGINWQQFHPKAGNPLPILSAENH